MTKLKIHPKGNGSRHNNSSNSNLNEVKLSASAKDDTLSYFLNKNSNAFSKEDLIHFQTLHEKLPDIDIITSKKIIHKLFTISKYLLNDTKETIQEKVSPNDFTALLANNFKELEPLITEIIEDDLEENTSFLKTLMDSLNSINETINKENITIEKLYDSLSKLLHRLQFYNITQQKYIYRKIASIINKKLNNYTLISPEDGNFVDTKYHEIIAGNGQRIVRGLSYILLDIENDEVLKFGKVKTI